MTDLTHTLLAITLVLIFSQIFGSILKRLRQPPVTGEIIGGLILGPTIIGHFYPDFYTYLFLSNDFTQKSLWFIYQFGLILLMFCSGMEIRSTFHHGEKKTSTWISLFSVIIPLLITLFIGNFFDTTPFIGRLNNQNAFILVFGIGIAVTSIPVISRILLDLNILDSAFARIILSAAVIEDILLYVALSVSLSLVSATSGEHVGILNFFHITPSAYGSIIYHVIINSVFFIFATRLGPKLFRRIESNSYNILHKDNSISFLLIQMLIITVLAMIIGIPPMFGAFVAGLVASHSSATPNESRQVVKFFSNSYFIPIYFALIGLKLDLIHNFDLAFFVIFFIGACIIKIISVYIGARIAREDHWSSLNLGIAMNARGGPGIVLASVALESGIINEHFYSILILLVILTSFLAGSWLSFVLKKGIPLRRISTE